MKYSYKDIRDAFYDLKDIIENVTAYPSRAFILGKLEELHAAFAMTLDEEARNHFVNDAQAT